MAHLSLTERDEFRVSLFVFRYGVKAETGVHHSGVCAVILDRSSWSIFGIEKRYFCDYWKTTFEDRPRGSDHEVTICYAVVPRAGSTCALSSR